MMYLRSALATACCVLRAPLSPNGHTVETGQGNQPVYVQLVLPQEQDTAQTGSMKMSLGQCLDPMPLHVDV
jgi:hypothetical protein